MKEQMNSYLFIRDIPTEIAEVIPDQRILQEIWTVASCLNTQFKPLLYRRRWRYFHAELKNLIHHLLRIILKEKFKKLK